MSSKHLFFSFLTLLLLATSCNIFRRDTKREIKDNVKQEQGVETIFNRMKDNQFEFRTLSVKFQATVISDKDKSVSFSGNLRIIKDRTIWLTMSAVLGIEAFRVNISPDSVMMINRLNKTYFKGDYQLINDILKTPFDFDMIQAIITGNDFTYYENNIFKIGEDALTYKISTPGRKKLKNYVANQVDMDKVLVQDLWISPETYKIVRQQIKELTKQNSKLTVDYTDFKPLGDQLLAHDLNILVEAEQKTTIHVVFEKVAWDEEVTVPFVIPESYQPMEQKTDKND